MSSLTFLPFLMTTRKSMLLSKLVQEVRMKHHSYRDLRQDKMTKLCPLDQTRLDLDLDVKPVLDLKAWLQATTDKTGTSGNKSLLIEELLGGGLIVKKTPGQSVFLYPDSPLGILGKFDENNILVQGHEVLLEGLDWSLDGLTPTLKMTDLNVDPLTFESPNFHTAACADPLRRDLFEHCNCYLDVSNITGAGEAIFAKRDLLSGSVVAYFNGSRKRRLMRLTSTQEEWSDYAITLNSDISLDMPEDQRSSIQYCATLGHKACHSFDPNCTFSKCFHPRFGLIIALVALKDIQAGDELLVNYRYPIRSAPDWYKRLWHQYLRRDKAWSLDNIHRYSYEAHDVHSRFVALNSQFSKEQSCQP